MAYKSSLKLFWGARVCFNALKGLFCRYWRFLRKFSFIAIF